LNKQLILKEAFLTMGDIGDLHLWIYRRFNITPRVRPDWPPMLHWYLCIDLL